MAFSLKSAFAAISNPPPPPPPLPPPLVYTPERQAAIAEVQGKLAGLKFFQVTQREMYTKILGELQKETPNAAEIEGTLIALRQHLESAAEYDRFKGKIIGGLLTLVSFTALKPLAYLAKAEVAKTAKTEASLLQQSYSTAAGLSEFLPSALSTETPMFEDFSFPSFSLPDGLLQGVGSLLTAKLQSDQQKRQLQLVAAQQGSAQQVMFPALPGLISGGARALAGSALGGAVVRAGRGLVTAAGRVISRKKVVAIAKQLGIQGAATALGVGALELAEMVVSEQGRKRGKGVTAAQLRTTRRTMNTVEKMHRQIAGYCRDAGVRGKTRTVFVPKSKACR